MPGYKKPLPEFTANWDLVILPEGEIKYTSSL
jgi:hypothetical protein